MDKYEDFLKYLFKKSPDIPQDGSGCITDETFASYLDNVLNEKETEKVEEHLSGCKECRQKNIILHEILQEIEEEGLMETPVRATETAKSLVKAPITQNLVEVVFGFTKDAVRIIKSAGAMLLPLETSPALAAGRGSLCFTLNEIRGIAKKPLLVGEFNGLLVALTANKSGKNECELLVVTLDARSVESVDNITLNLVSEGKTIDSHPTTQGYAIFRKLPFDAYSLLIVRGQETLGTINLTLVLEQ